MTKLIILNGPLGVGKSTLAERYAKDHPLTLVLDIDKVRKLLSNWREQKEDSAIQSKKMAVEMARVHLQGGYDVVVPQFYRQVKYLEELERLAGECGADFYEFVLFLCKEEAVHRFIERGKKEGRPLGFNPEGIIGRSGGIAYVKQTYDEMAEAIAKRPNTINIKPKLDDVEATYQEVISHLL